MIIPRGYSLNTTIYFYDYNMHNSNRSLISVASYAMEHGIDKASVNFELKHESVSRYVREARNRGLIEDGDAPHKAPNILVLDIETSPLEAGVWGLWKQNVYIDQIYSEWFMLTWAAKWLYENDVYSDKLTGQEAMMEDDKRICESLWRFVDHADVIIAHNGDKFDLVRMNTRFLVHGLNPPSPYQSIDTLKVAKRNFGFSSNKLDFIARFLGLSQKSDDGGFVTWKNIVKFGDEDALELMEDYNKQDVLVLEEVYVKLRPWIKSHPNLALHYDLIEERCPSCGSTNLVWEEGKYYVTPLNKYSAVRCADCGAVGRARTSSLTQTERAELISTTAR